MSNIRATTPNPTWTCTTAQLGRVLAGITGLPIDHTNLLAARAKDSGQNGETTFSTETHLLDGPLSNVEATALATRQEWLVRRIHELGRDYRIIRTSRTVVSR